MKREASAAVSSQLSRQGHVLISHGVTMINWPVIVMQARVAWFFKCLTSHTLPVLQLHRWYILFFQPHAYILYNVSGIVEEYGGQM